MAKIELTEDYRVVLYTDGASSPNPGPTGSSIHGYIYNTAMLNTKTTDKPLGYSITTKGYIPGELKESTKEHTLVKPSYYLDGIYVHKDTQTNNVGELQAIAYGLDKILHNVELPITEILILSDSMYAIGVLTKCLNNENIDNNIPNKIYYDLFTSYIEEAKENGILISIDKVKGHDISIGNNIADRLAVAGRLIASNGNMLVNDFNLIEAKSYWSSHLDRHPYLKYKQVFFLNTDREKEQPIYSIMAYKTGIELGKKSPEPIFGTYLPKEPIKEIEEVIKEFQLGTIGRHIPLGTIDLSVLYNQRTSRYYSIFGNNIFNMSHRGNTMLVMDEEPVAYAVIPSGLPLKTIDQMIEHRTILEEYKNNTGVRNFIDITELFYKKEIKITKKKEEEITICALEPSCDKLDVHTKYLGNDVLIPLSLGVSLPDRNTFKKIEKDDVKVILVIEPNSENMFSYYIIIDNKTTEDLSIWCNLYSNKVLLGKKIK